MKIHLAVLELFRKDGRRGGRTYFNRKRTQ